MRRLAILALFLAASSAEAAVEPAATLLLPYFEVDVNAPQTTAATTAFTITNVTPMPQIAYMTIWTDWGFPVLSVNIFLTGYDQQRIDLYDVLARKFVGTNGYAGNQVEPGSRSYANDANPHFLPQAAGDCAALPGPIPPNIAEDVRNAVTSGTIHNCGTTRIGSTHTNAIGYVTIDVMADCDIKWPTDPKYFDEILYDNVLTGYYTIYDGKEFDAAPLVHIRATPTAQMPKTFYGRLSNGRDRREPLPSSFDARYAFQTTVRLWRDGTTGPNATCASYQSSGIVDAPEVVRFDEHENATVRSGPSRYPLYGAPPTPLAIAADMSSVLFPAMPSSDAGGWMKIDSPSRQSWVATTMRAGGYSVTEDAAINASENDTCDITVTPAATLLLPYFEVDPAARAHTTIFTVTNTSSESRIARVTLWTDLAYPMFTFNIPLTGYDSQAIDVADTILGSDDLRNAFIHGVAASCPQIGLDHKLAVGYATIDLVATLGTTSPNDPGYFDELLYDNVLTGDWAIVDGGNDSAGAPLVHIRAVPDLPYTFYDRYTTGGVRTRDRRQPLPAVFAFPWLRAADSVDTKVLVWREGVVGGGAACSEYKRNYKPTPQAQWYQWHYTSDAVTFDEHENSTSFGFGGVVEGGYSPLPVLPAAMSAPLGIFPYPPGDEAGWIYFDLSNGGSTAYSASRKGFARSQGWVMTVHSWPKGYTVTLPATMLANGCTLHVQGSSPLGP